MLQGNQKLELLPTDSNIRVAKKCVNVYVTKVAPDYTVEELQAQILAKTNIETKCYPMQSRYPELYSSFRVTAAK